MPRNPNIVAKFANSDWTTENFQSQKNAQARMKETIRLYHINILQSPLEKDIELLNKSQTIDQWLRINNNIEVKLANKKEGASSNQK